MIHADRNSIDIPKFYSSKQHERLISELKAQLARSATQKEQARYKFDLRTLRKNIVGPLLQLFGHKCAYCEDTLELGSMEVDQFRPVSLYPWLAYEWANLYPICQECKRNKGHQFPLTDESARVESAFANVSNEQPLLLDPCNTRPEQYLHYDDEGLISSSSHSTAPMGDATIDVLGLNRSSLKKRRKLLSENIRKSILHNIAELLIKPDDSPARKSSISKTSTLLVQSLRPDARFAGLFRQLIAVYLLANRAHKQWFNTNYPDSLEFLKDAFKAERKRQSTARKSPQEKKIIREAATVSKRRRRSGSQQYFDSGATPSTPASRESAPAGASPKKAVPKKAASKKAAPKKAVTKKRALKKTAVSTASSSVVPVSENPDQHHPLFAEIDSLPVTNATITSICISNFKAIHRLRLKPLLKQDETILESKADQQSLGDMSGWMTLLGENGSGKSSILQAIALALAGDQLLQISPLQPVDFVMHKKRSAKIEIELTRGDPIVLKITKTKFIFESGAAARGVFVRAYGSTRLLPIANSDTSAVAQASRVQFLNMFDPFLPLRDTDQWLSSLSQSDFRPARLAIKDLLNLDDDQEVQNSNGEILVDGQPLSKLSAGYQTIVALACDIMAGVPHILKDMQQAQGIVLIDEIGAHLHPQWKMHLVPRLRKAFPLVQFLISTHDPLCLRGHSKGEVVLVVRAPDPKLSAKKQKTAARIVSVDSDLPSPQDMRVDQLLMSRHFGMASTIDPVIDEKFNEYYQLLAQKRSLTDEQNGQRIQLAAELQQHGVLGYTRRDQLVYEAIDEYLANEPDLRAKDRDSSARKARRQEVKKRIGKLWRYANAYNQDGAE